MKRFLRWFLLVVAVVAAAFFVSVQAAAVGSAPVLPTVDKVPVDAVADKRILEASTYSPCDLQAVICPHEQPDYQPPLEDTIRDMIEPTRYDPSLWIEFALCESSMDPQADSNEPYLGLYQWDPRYIPGGEGCALDVQCSTEATIQALDRGENWRWPSCLKDVILDK